MKQQKPAVASVAAMQVLNIEERFPGYRKEVIKRLLKIVQAQDTHGTSAARRSTVEQELSSLAELVAVTEGGVTE